MYKTITDLLKDKACRFAPTGPSIGEIEALAAGIRNAFIGRAVPADEPVYLCVEEKHHLLAALLASLAGAPTFVLPHSFDSRVLREIQGTKPFHLILADRAVDPPAGTTVISVGECSPDDRPLALVRPPDRSFISLFTGGSTGKPRTWDKTPANLFGEAIHLARTFGVGRGDLLLSTVPPQHIYGLLGSVLLPFVASARVLRRTCILPREILSTLQNDKPTVLVSAPIHYRAMRSDDLQRFSLRLALSSAAPLDSGDAAFFLQRTGLAITEIYGSTETGGMAIRAYGSDHGSWEPFSCIDWKILADRLCVHSDFVSPDLPCDEEGFFMTADRVVKAGVKRFKFLGRADHIIKIAGKRVDLEEIREKIRQIAGVNDAYVTVAPFNGGRQSAIAALVASDLPARKLSMAIRSMDDPYGRPRRIRVVKAIPILPNGKIDRQRIDQLLFA
jgi:acyl-coenzyme A synthetase/AMP-(fatty) acid ligase